MFWYRAPLLFIFCTCTTGIAEQLIKVKIINHNKVCFYVSSMLIKKYVRGPLYLTYPNDIDLTALPSSIVDIPLITNVISAVWFSGETFTIEEMDEDLYYSLIKVKEFFKRFFYNTPWNGELQPKRLVKNNLSQTSNQSALLFSGGLDSTTTVFRHADKNPVLISFNNIHKKSTDFAQSHHFNHQTIFFNHYDFLKLSKLDKASLDISKWFWDTTMGLSWVGAAAPFLYAKGIPVLYIPSGFTWQSFIFPDGQTLQQPACPLIDENLSPFGLSVKHDVFTMTRPDKIKFIATFCKEKNIPKPQLVVCNFHSRHDVSYLHCDHCFKCLITMLDILAIGESLQEYGFTLSEEAFMHRFRSYIATLTMRRGGTYVALRDTQRYVQQNLASLPQAYRPFFDWFIQVDLESKITETSKRPPRTTPFRWDDYRDLYSSIPDEAL